MSVSRLYIGISVALVIIGVIALFDGYAEYASGEETVVRWLMLPTAMFLGGGTAILRARQKSKDNEGHDA